MENYNITSDTIEDILLERRNSSDLRWAARNWQECSVYKYKKTMSKSQLYLSILKSERVASCIENLASDRHERKKLEKRVAEILDDMSHTLSIGEVRKFAVSMPKIMKRIYNKILVNVAGVNKLKEIVPETPVLLLPTHRSYADFLLISYLAFHYMFSLPVIAAGMDFMSMSIIGDMLRGSGAFYIRRSFMDDKLYWAVFQEYVQTLLLKSGQPLEFFVEGTRSRSGKSLPPKIGLLGCATECWLRGKLPDILIVPISISYNRTLEESLFAYEMLGVSKPKESTSGLIKAMKILKENYGNIYVHFGSPISMSEFLSPRVDRYLHGYHDYLTPLSLMEKQACENLGLHVLRTLQENCVISTWCLASICFLRSLWLGLRSIPKETLLKETTILSNIIQNLGSRVEGANSKDEFKNNLMRNLADHKLTVTTEENDVKIIQLHKQDHFGSLNQSVISLQSSTIGPAVTHLLLQYYVNQTLHLFIRPALVSLALKSYGQRSVPKQFLISRFSLLANIFSYDFIFEPHEERKDLEKSLELLKEHKCIEMDPQTIQVLESVDTSGSFLCHGMSLRNFCYELICPFILCYQVAIDVSNTEPSWTSESCLVAAIQKELESSAVENLLYSSLSLDTCRHSVKMLLKMTAVTRSKSATNDQELVPKVERLSFLKEALKPSLITCDLLHPKL